MGKAPAGPVKPSVTYHPVKRPDWERRRHHVYFECPGCGKGVRISMVHWPIDAAGRTDMPFICVGEDCAFQERLVFEGWPAK